MNFIGKNKSIAYLLIVLSIFCTSCSKDLQESVSETVTDDTYCNLLLRIDYGGDVTRSTLEEGTVEENKVVNLMIYFFDKNGTLDVSNYYDVADLTYHSGDANLGKGYLLKAPMMVSAGQKKIVVLMNVPSVLKTKLSGVTSYTQLRNFELETGEMYRDYLKEQGFTNIYKPGLNDLDKDPAFNFNAILMSGQAEAYLEAGVTQSEVMAAQKNFITSLYVDRTVAKVTLKFDGFSVPDLSMNSTIYPLYIHLNNLPRKSYLIRRPGNRSPYFYSLDFANNYFANEWIYQEAYSDARALRSTKTYANLAKHRYTFYFPENTFNAAYRGNVTSLFMRFPFNGKLSYFYDEETQLTHRLSSSSLADGITKFFKNIFSIEGIDASRIVDMPSYTKTREAQEVELAKKTLNPSGWYVFVYRTAQCDPTFETERWYDEVQLYYYTGDKDADDQWIRKNRKDFRAVYYVDGHFFYRLNLGDLSSTSDFNRYLIPRNVWYDVTITGYRENTAAFKTPGYPRFEDLNRRKGDRMDDAWLEVGIKVRDWTVGGNNDETIGPK